MFLLIHDLSKHFPDVLTVTLLNFNSYIKQHVYFVHYDLISV